MCGLSAQLLCVSFGSSNGVSDQACFLGQIKFQDTNIHIFKVYVKAIQVILNLQVTNAGKGRD